MLITHNTNRCSSATSRAVRRGLAAILFGLVLILPSQARAETGPIAPGEVMSAFREVDRWVRAWEAPDEPRLIDPQHATGACVTLRFAGEVIGRATVFSDEGDALWRATSESLVQAIARLPVANDALRSERLSDLASMIAIEIQVAGELVPLLGETFEVAAAPVAKGIEGVAGRVGDRVEGVFPGTLLATRRSPFAGLEGLRSRLGLPLLELDRLRNEHGMKVYKFDAVQLAQPRPGDAPVFLYRGGRIVPLAEVTVDRARSLADEVAGHILDRRWGGEGPLGMRGDYHPTINRFDPAIAPPLKQAVAAYALARYAGTPGIDASSAERARRGARAILEDLTRVHESEPDPLAEPPAVAAWLLAHIELVSMDPESEGALEHSFAQPAIETITRALRSESPSLAPGAEAMLAHALASVAALPDSDTDGAEVARSTCTSLLRRIDATRLVGAMPWLGWALVELAGEEPVGAAQRLREMRELAWRHQFDATQAGADGLDLTGGIVFSRGRYSRPTYRTMFPAAFLATMLGREDFTDPGERNAEIMRLMKVLRFAIQLTPGREESHLYPDPARAEGGVRRAVWDHTMSLDACAMTLLTICETLRSLE